MADSALCDGEIWCTATEPSLPIAVVPLEGDLRRQCSVILRSPTHPDRGTIFGKDGLSWESANRVADVLRRLFNITADTKLDASTYYEYASNAELRDRVVNSTHIGRNIPALSVSSSTTPSSSSSVAAESADNECPICFEAVTINTSVRCLSQPCHFFHNACLGRWISQFHHSVPSCPICRQGIEIDTQLLAQYMNDPQSDIEMGPDDRRRLQYLLDSRMGAWETMRAAAKDARVIVDVPVNMFRGATCGFDTLSVTQNERLDEGLRIMRSFMRVAYRIFPERAEEYPVSVWRPHSYVLRWFRKTRKRILDWTFARVQQTEREVERAREFDEENARIEEFNHAQRNNVYTT